MKKPFTVFAIGCALFFLNACTSSATIPTEIAPTLAPSAQTATPEPTAAAISTRVERRAPTLAPTATATIVLPTEIPSATATVENSATPLPSATNTRANVALTATPALAKAVFVTKIKVEPPQPKSKPSEFFFTVNFLNTVGENVNYPRWRVLIFRQGETKTFADPEGTSKTIVVGASQQTTRPSSINVASVCESFTAQPVWEDENGKQNPLAQTDGKPVTMDFQVCP